MHKKLFTHFSLLLTLWIVSLATPLAIGDDPPAKKQAQSDAKNGGIVTLYALDPIASTFSFKYGQYAGVIQDYMNYNGASDIKFGNGSFGIARTGASALGKIIDLGTADDLQKKYGYSETMGNGQGFASIHKKDGKVLILKADDGTGMKRPIPKDNNDDYFQPIKETGELFGEGEKRAYTSIKLGHIYLLRLTDRRDKTIERVVKLLVISYKENESLTIRWEVLE